MREGARAAAAELGVKLSALAGRDEGDNEGQAAAIEACIADDVDGILQKLSRLTSGYRHALRADRF